MLEGSCHCGAVRFRVRSEHPHPFDHRYGWTCRKTAGGGGYAIYLSGRNETLEVEGAHHLRVYRVRMRDERGETVEVSQGERNFCGHCGSALWLWDPRWPELVQSP